MALRRSGGLLIASRSGLNLFDFEQGKLRPMGQPEPGLPGNRSNDGVTDRRGRFWFGTMQNNLAEDGSEIPVTQQSGSLYRVDQDSSVERVFSDIGIPNSIAFSPDGRRMYFTDTLTGWIEVFDCDPERGELKNRHPFAQAEGQGYPDGSAVDSEGFLWNARWGGWCVLRFAPDGSFDRRIEVPAEKVTCCVFGGRRLDRLYITTARQGLSSDELLRQPHAGGLFEVEPGVRGLPASQWGE